MRLGLGVVAGVAFLSMLLLDTQAVLQTAWMAALGRLGPWPQRALAGVVLAAAAGWLVAAGLRRRRTVPRPAPRRAPKQAALPSKAVRKGSPKAGPKGRRPAAPGAAAGRTPARPSRA